MNILNISDSVIFTLQNIHQYSSRNKIAKSRANNVLLKRMHDRNENINKLSKETELLSEQKAMGQFYSNNSSDLAIVESLFILTVLRVFHHLISSREYLSWWQHIRIQNDFLSQYYINRIEMMLGYKEDQDIQYDRFMTDKQVTEIRNLNHVDSKFSSDVVAEKRLHQFIDMVESLPIGVSIIAVKELSETRLDGELKFPIAYANEMYGKIFGSRENVIGHDFMDFQRDKDNVSNRHIIKNALENRTSLKLVASNYTTTGQKFKHALGIQPMMDTNGTYSYIVCLHFDVSASSVVAAPSVDEMMDSMMDSLSHILSL